MPRTSVGTESRLKKAQSVFYDDRALWIDDPTIAMRRLGNPRGAGRVRAKVEQRIRRSRIRH